MNLKEIKDIIKLMNENNLDEIEVEREGAKLKLKKSSLGQVETFYRPPQPSNSPELPVSSPVSVSSQAPASESNQKEITSPMIGTFYRAPSPEAPPFVEIGQIVEIGQVVCIVEAMKLMNEIKSEIKGKITQVLVDNAEPVEFGQPLFAVEPVGKK